MPFPNEHAARIVSPEGFERFARKNIKPGIDIILGIKDGKSTTQSYRFKKSKFSADEAKAWLKKNNIKYISFEKAARAKTQSFVYLQVHKIQAFSKDQILALIPPNILAEIKTKDPHPFFQAYSIAHEGISSPKVLGDTSKPIHWTKKAIQSIKNIITKGIKFFFGHNEDNSTENRRILGEVIADTQQEIDGILHHIVISYHSPEIRDEVKQYDIVSQEAEWNFFEAAQNLIADTVEKITGIAMGSSKNDTPAFFGAKRLAMVQALDNDEEPGEPVLEENKEMTKEELLNSITFHDLKPIIEKLNVFPSQLFSIEQLKADRNLTVFQELENAQKQITEYEEKNKTLIQQTLKANAAQRFKELIDDQNLKLTDGQRKYLESLKSDDFDDLTDEGLLNFRDNALKWYSRVNASSTDASQVVITNPDVNNNQSTNSDDYTKVDNNPLLDEDYNS